MKKFLVSLLLLCLFASSLGAFVSCGNKTDGPEIYTIMEKETAPTRIVTQTRYVTEDTDGSELVLEGSFDTKTSGNDSYTVFSYQRLSMPEELAEERITTVRGTSWIKDGEPGASGDAIDEDAIAEAAVTAIRLNSKKLEKVNVKISEDGKTLTAQIPASSVASVIGVPVLAIGNVTLTVTTNGTYVTGITFSYISANGAAVTVQSSYSYNALTVTIPEAK